MGYMLLLSTTVQKKMRNKVGKKFITSMKDRLFLIQMPLYMIVCNQCWMYIIVNKRDMKFNCCACGGLISRDL